MEFLKEDFLDQLRAEIDDTTGNVVIEAAQFTPQKILEFNSETFDMAFDEWCENKKQERLEKADEILALYDNQRRFEVLKASYNRGAVIPFIGAGMSMPCGYSGWTDYLREILKETRLNPQDLEALLSDSKYEEAAQLLFDSMPTGSFNESLENTFDHDLPLAGAVRYVPYIFANSSVITTNFDGVLKRSYEEAEENFSEVLLGSEAVEFPRLLGAGKNILVKLHGKATSGKNRVLTLDEYNIHYADEGSLQNCIKAISNKTLLFLGCSLGADRTVQCLKDIVEAQGADATPRHYALLAVTDNGERLVRRDILVESNIHPIWYSSDDDHDECIMGTKQPRRPDIICFINGLPISVLELKSPSDEHADIWDAFNQIQTYKDEISDLFIFNEANIISDGYTARMGALTANQERFMPWRTLKNEKDQPLLEWQLETMVRGFFDRELLPDYIRYFVLFENDGEKIIKKIASYHQFHAVREAVNAPMPARPTWANSLKKMK